MARALFHHGLAIEFDDRIPRLTVDGQAIPLPSAVEDAAPGERWHIGTDRLIEYAKQHVDVSEGFTDRDRIRDSHVQELQEGVEHWNEWRRTRPAVRPLLYEAKLAGKDLSGANLANANLIGADLTRATLIGTNFHEANLGGADLSHAKLANANFCRTDLFDTILFHADLENANLQGTQLARTDFRSANLAHCRIYGFSAWDLQLDQHTNQKDLAIVYERPRQKGEQRDSVDENREVGRVFVDDLRVAQFVYLMLHNENIRYVLDAVSKKAVLILGRFSQERKRVLDAIRESLRARKEGFIPLLFDFEKPANREYDETVRVLAGLCRFVIADITDPSSVPLELGAIVPHNQIPVVPIIQRPEKPFSMLAGLQTRHWWLLDVAEYSSIDDLLDTLEEKVISRAFAAERRILSERSRGPA